MRASYSLFDRSVDRVFPLAAGGGEGDDSAIGQNISGAIVNRFGLNENPCLRALAGDAQIAGIGSDLLQRAPRRQIIQRRP